MLRVEWDALRCQGDGCTEPAPDWCYGGGTGLLQLTGLSYWQLLLHWKWQMEKNQATLIPKMTYGKPSNARMFLMLFLLRWWRKLIAYLMQKAWGGIHAFLGKIMLYCDCNKDTVFNFSSSRVPKSRQTYLAWAKLVVTFDLEVTRTGRVVFSAGCKVIHIVCPACFTLKGSFFSHLGFL